MVKSIAAAKCYKNPIPQGILGSQHMITTMINKCFITNSYSLAAAICYWGCKDACNAFYAVNRCVQNDRLSLSLSSTNSVNFFSLISLKCLVPDRCWANKSMKMNILFALFSK